jgi:transcription attenuation protein (tryptophan RNA-binding attenuator protein)
MKKTSLYAVSFSFVLWRCLRGTVDIESDFLHDMLKKSRGRGDEQVESDWRHGECFVVKAKENGVQVIGLTRGQDTKFHHTEKLDKGEVMIAQFTDHTSAVKVRGKAIVMTRHGVIDTEE